MYLFIYLFIYVFIYLFIYIVLFIYHSSVLTQDNIALSQVVNFSIA